MTSAKSIVPILTAATLMLTGSALAQEANESERVTSSVRFSGTAAVRADRTLEAATDTSPREPVNVEIRNWTIGGGMRMDKLDVPSNGTLVVQLRAGELVTIIDGERRERHPGEFWTVEAGQTMALETDDDTATLQTIFVAD